MRRPLALVACALGVALALASLCVPADARAADLGSCSIDIAPAVYTGAPVRPHLDVRAQGRALVHGEDYVAAWRRNVNAGVARVTLSGQGEWSGRKTAFFPIGRAQMSGASVSPASSSYPYTGAPVLPGITASFGGKQLKEGRDFAVEAVGDGAAGAAAARVVGKRNLVGTVTVEFQIEKAQKPSLSGARITVDDAVYTGKPRKPRVVVELAGARLAEGRDYTVSYRDNLKAGTGQAVVSGAGAYGGSASARFKIRHDPGVRLAAAAVALAGGWSEDNRAPGPKASRGGWSDAQKAPPDKKTWRGRTWDWRLYKKVYAKVNDIRPGKRIHHACCDCLPVLAVLWAGLDDGYLKDKWPGTEEERSYLSKSGKWERVGGKGKYWHTNGGKGYGDKGVALEPGDILCTRAGEHNHWMIYVGHEAAAKRWGKDTKVVFVDEAYGSRWTSGKPMSSRGKTSWLVFRRNAKSLDPDGSKYAGIQRKSLEKYLVG